MTFDESWVFLNNYNKKGLCIIKNKEKKNAQNWFRQCKESFSKEFMI